MAENRLPLLSLPAEILVRCLSGICIAPLLSSCKAVSTGLQELALSFAIVLEVEVVTTEVMESNRPLLHDSSTDIVNVYNPLVKAKMPGNHQAPTEANFLGLNLDLARNFYSTDFDSLWKIVALQILREDSKGLALTHPTVTKRLLKAS